MSCKLYIISMPLNTCHIFGYPMLVLEYDNKLYRCKDIINLLKKYFNNKNITLSDINTLHGIELDNKLCLIASFYTIKINIKYYVSHYQMENILTITLIFISNAPFQVEIARMEQ